MPKNRFIRLKSVESHGFGKLRVESNVSCHQTVTGGAKPDMDAQRRPSVRGDRLKQLRAFCHAARLGSITRAAEYIFSSQPAVSQQVRALEDDLEVTLFERNGPRISLSPAGRQLYEAAMPVVAGMDRLPFTFAEQHHGDLSGELHLAAGRATAAFAMPEYLRRFRERHRAIRVNVRTGTGQERIDWLRAYEVDIVFGAIDVPPPDLDFHFIFPSRFFLVTSEGHPLAGRESVEIAEAAAYPLILPAAGSYARRVADLIARQHGLTIDVVVEVNGWSVIKRYVEAGIGISVVPDLCLTDRDRVWRIPFDRYLPDRRYGVLMRRDPNPSLAAERFIQLVDPGFRIVTK